MSDIIWANEKCKLGDLTGWERNPRYSTEKQAQRIVESHQAFGQVDLIAVDSEGVILNGHQRLNSWLAEYGKDYEVEIRRADRTLDEAERQALTALLHAGAVGSWDFDALANWGWDAEEFESFGFDPDLAKEWHENAFALEGLLASDEEPPKEDTEPQIDKAEELRVKWGVELGQMWQLGEHRIICGDCTDKKVVERVMGGEKARYAMQDPPYGIDIVGGSKSFGSVGGSNIVKANNYKPIEGDNKPFDPDYILSLCPDSILWGANYYANKLQPKKAWIVWDKKGKEWEDNFSDCELAWSPFDRVTKVYRFLYMGIVQEGKREVRQHPTQKPTGLYELLIKDYFIDSGIILDCFSGSGTTIIACENLSRKCRAVEIDAGYVAVALQRFKDHAGIEPVLMTV